MRLTGQRIITAHLVWPEWVKEQPPTFWPSADLDLHGAELHAFSLENCRLRRADLSSSTLRDCSILRTTFAGVPWGTSGPTGVGGVYFRGATFEGDAVFEDVDFHGDVSFEGAVFTNAAYLGGVTCSGEASFRRATFFEQSSFEGSHFRRGPDFSACKFADDVSFSAGAIYAEGATLSEPDFTDCEFYGAVDFSGASFHLTDSPGSQARNERHMPNLAAVRIVPRPDKQRSWPTGWTERASAGEGGFHSLQRANDPAG